MKVCPICKSRCFDDMDTCYGCLYNFDKQEDDVFVYRKKEENSMPHIPEYFEIDAFPYIEEDDLVDVELFNNKSSKKPEETIKIHLEIPKSFLSTFMN